MTSDQERAAPAQQPVAWRCDECGCASYARMDERKPEGGFGPSPLVRCVNCKKVHNVPASSEPELTAEIVSLTRERDAAVENYNRTWNQRDAQRRRAEAAESRVEALSAEVGKLTEALEPFSVIAGEYFAQNLNRDDIVASIKRPDGTRLDITAGHLFDARAALDRGATR